MSTTATGLPRPSWADSHTALEGGITWEKYTPEFPMQEGRAINAYATCDDLIDPATGAVNRGEPVIAFEGMEFTPANARDFANAILGLVETVEADK